MHPCFCFAIIICNNSLNPMPIQEQRKTCPWLIVSEESLNKHTPIVWAIPFAAEKKKYPLTFIWNCKVQGTKTDGTLLVTQLTALNLQIHWAKLVEHVNNIPKEIYEYVDAILGKDNL